MMRQILVVAMGISILIVNVAACGIATRGMTLNSSMRTITMPGTDRRRFLKNAAAATRTALAATTAIVKTRRSANESLRVGLLGMCGRMRAHVTALAASTIV